MKRGVGPAVLAAVVLATVSAQAQEKKREAPRPVAPVTIAGIRYEALPFGKARGLEQNGGYVAALDASTGRELWLAKVYKTREDPGVEGDKQDEFITAMRPTRNGRSLVVETERGGRYELDLETRRARRL